MRGRRVSASIVIILVFLNMFLIFNPVQAHFTLGNLTGTYPYHANDFDPHVSGVIGYVWPGGGQNTYSGFPNAASVALSPGYQSPYPRGKPPGAVSESWYQLEGNSYSPFGAVLTRSTGDLIFAINSTSKSTCLPKGNPCGWDSWVILIPPNFIIPGQSQIVSTLTNSGNNIFTTQLSPYDRYAPGWWVVSIKADAAINPGYNHQYINFTSASEWYYVRVNAVTAPQVAGRYFFKMMLYGGAAFLAPNSMSSTGGTASNSQASAKGEPPTQFIPTQNWPVLLVKGEIDPAIITGTIRYAGYNQTLYSKPLGEAGRVYAKMTTRLDPYTGQGRSDLPLVDGVGYFNATAQGHYEVEGLAPGVYDLYASAAGYPQTLFVSGVTVLKGQSLHLDGYIQPGAVIHGNVFTKHQFGDEPWPENTYVKVELYDRPTLHHKLISPDAPPAPISPPNATYLSTYLRTKLVTWSPLPCVAGGQNLFYGYGHAGNCGDPRLGSMIAFPWHEYGTPAGYTANQVSVGSNNYCGTGGAVCATLTQDPQGVGPPQHWYVQGGTTTPFHYEFGVKGEYGAPRDLDGMVPQVYATWINGLTPGRYYARVWVFRYVQSALDGSTFQEYYFDVSPNEWAGDVTLPIDLRLGSWVNETVHYHIMNDTLTEDPIDTGAAFLYGILADMNGHDYSYNVTALGYKMKYSTSGEGLCGGQFCNNPPPFISGEDLDPALINTHAVETGRATIQFWGINDTWGGMNYGILPGTYTANIYSLGYFQGTPQEASVTLSGNPTSISDHLYRGPGFNITVYSIDWERPRVSRSWVWGNDQAGVCAPSFAKSGVCERGAPINIQLYDATTDVYGYVGDSVGGLPVTITTTNLFQNSTTSYVEMNGGGWSPQRLLPDGTYVQYDGHADQAYFGIEAPYPYVGGNTPGTFVFLTCIASAYCPMLGWVQAWFATSFDPGLYQSRAFTYGYIQNENVSVYVQAGQVANFRIYMTVGVNITLDVLFKKEQVIAGTAANMSARVRIFNDEETLVAEWMSSEGTYTTASGFARAADGTTLYPIIYGKYSFTNAGSKLQSYNFLPGGTALLHVLMAGLPQLKGQFGDPIFTSNSCPFDLYCYNGLPSAYGRYLPPSGAPVYLFSNSGIIGSPDYQGDWTAEVDFVNYYANNTVTTIGGTQGGQYYPPVVGLLMGESYHMVPGSNARSGISLTEDGALSFLHNQSMASNHFGPYSQQSVWQISNAHLSGEASGIFEVDLNGLVSGNALAFTWSNEFRPLSWGLVNVVGATGSSDWNFYTYDGVYQTYLPPGTYKFTISSRGLAAQTYSVAVSSGMISLGYSTYLEESNIPVPEFNAITISTFSALAASTYLLRRRHH